MDARQPAYLIGHITIKDADKWAAYRDQVPATLVPWDAELVFRGVLDAALAGRQGATDVVVIRFPDVAAINGWFHSAAYQALVPLRQQAAEVELASYRT